MQCCSFLVDIIKGCVIWSFGRYIYKQIQDKIIRLSDHVGEKISHATKHFLSVRQQRYDFHSYWYSVINRILRLKQ